jgi:ketosteroid isomerase-like protein
MSQQNVEFGRAFFVAWNARDAEGVDRLLHPDAKVTRLSDRAGFPEPSWGAKTSEYFSGLDEAWAALRVQIAEYCQSGDSVVALGRMSGIGRASGVEVDRPFATVFIIRASRFSRVDSFGNWDDALEAAGLRE